MAEFPPKLDDGEFWLPSDVFPSEVVPSKFNNHPYDCFSVMDDFARQLASLSILQNYPRRNPSAPLPKPPPNLQVKPAVRDVSVNHGPPGRYLGSRGGVELGQRLHWYGSNSPISTRPDPFYELQVCPQVDSYMEARARALQQKQQNRLQNRVYPFRGSVLRLGGGGGGGGGFSRESGGTGVFHPRIVNPATTTSTATVVRKKQGVRNSRSDIQITQQRINAMKLVDLNKQEDCYYHLPPDMGFPQDWTC